MTDTTRYSTAPRCGGRDDAGDQCQRELDDGQDDGRWLVLTGKYGQPCYFICPECEQKPDIAAWIERQLSPEGEAAGCTGMLRLETGSPREVLGMIRDIPCDDADDE